MTQKIVYTIPCLNIPPVSRDSCDVKKFPFFVWT